MADKIGVLFLHSQNIFGADSAVHADLVRNLDRDRFTVHVACSEGDGTGVPASLEAFGRIPDIRLRPTHFAPGFRHRTPATLLRGLLAGAAFPFDFVSLRNYVEREGIRIIHSTDRPRDTVYAAALARVTGAKAITHVHVAWSRLYSAPAQWGLRNSDAIFSISRFVTETLVAVGLPRERVYTILNAIDPTRWDPGLDGSAVRRELGIPPDAPLLASVSRLFAQKGQRELVQAFARLRADVKDLRLLIVGADAIEVHGSSFTAELKTLALELGVADAVVFAGPRSDVPRIMAACDIFTMPSFEEPFGLVFLEAMAMQRPVIGLDNGGTPEVVEHGKSGLLSDAADIRGLARNIRALLDDRQLRVRMGGYGRARVLDYFNARRMAQDAGNAYRTILGERRAEDVTRRQTALEKGAR